jgi:NADPH2:quinone reductase
MKAIVMIAAGEPDVLQLQEVPMPQIRGEREVLVRLMAAGVNPIDTKIRARGTFYPERGAAILGCDGAGIIEAIGAGVQEFRVGDEVYFCRGGLGADPGNYAEYTVVDERYITRKPAGISFAEAAAAPLVLITAWEALFDRARLQSGTRVLIQAGAGGVGHVAIQLAHLHGASVCTTVSTEAKAEFTEALGAEQAILYTQTDSVEAVRSWSNGEGVDLAFDTVGGAVLSQCFAATRFYGDVVTLLAPDPKTDWKLARDRNLRVSYELMLTPVLKGLVSAQAHQASILRQCASALERGKLRMQVSHTFPLAAAAEAHRCIEQGSTLGKVVLLLT